MKGVQLEPAYLLSVKRYRETSALLEAFTRSHGRVGLVARGARGERSRLRGVLQPFQPLLLSWHEGGELGTLRAAEPAGAAPVLRGEAVFSGWYLNELALRLLQRRDAHPLLFDAYAAALGGLGGAGAEAALRIFEKRLLAEIGYGLHLPQAGAGEWLEPEGDGAWRVAEPGPRAYAGASLQALAEERLDSPQALRDARRLLRAALARHLGERQLRTPRLLRAMRAATALRPREGSR